MMAKFHFITTLLICHTLLRVNVQSTSSILPSSTTVSPTSNSTPSLTTSPPCEGTRVNITIYVLVSNCSGASYENVSSPEYRDLEGNLKGNLTVFYTRCGVNYVLTITLKTAQCTGNFVKVVVTITFNLGIGFNIEDDIKTEISDGSLVSLPVNGTLVEVAFIGQSASNILPCSTTVPSTSTCAPSSTTSPPAEGQSSILPSTTTVPPTSTSTPSMNTSPPGQGQSSIRPSTTTVPPTSTSTPSMNMSPPGGGQSSIRPSTTTVPPTFTHTPSPTTSPPCEAIGAEANITIYVRVSNCSGASYKNVSSPEYRDLERNLKGNLTDFYTRGGVNYVLNITLQLNAQCAGNYVKVVVMITFKLGIEFNIEEDFKTKISNNYLVSLPVNGTRTLVEVAFIDVGAQVNVTIYVRVSNCNGASYENGSSPEYRDLERNLKGNLTDFYTRDGVNYVLIIALQTTQCMGNYVKVVVKITFKLGIEFNIEVDIKTKISNNSLVSLPVNGTLVEVAFICQSSILPSTTTVPPGTTVLPGEGQSTSSILPSSTTVPPTSTSTPSSTTTPSQGYDIKYKIKEGECERVCCDKGEGAAGGPVKMIPTCTPPSDDSQCKDEKEESGHCPGDPDDRCSAICSAFSVQCPSFALLGLLAVATFFRFSVF